MNLQLYNHHLIFEHFHHLKERSCAHWPSLPSCPCSPRPQASATSSTLCADLPSRSSPWRRIIEYVDFRIHCLSLSIGFLRLLRVIGCSSTSLFLWLESIPLYGHVCKGRPNKMRKTGLLPQQTFIFPQPWRLDVQDQGVSTFDFFCNLSPRQMAACSRGLVWPFLGAHASLGSFCVSRFPLLRTPVRLDLGASLMASF